MAEEGKEVPKITSRNRKKNSTGENQRKTGENYRITKPI